MLVNPLKTNALVISWSRTFASNFANLLLEGTVVECEKELKDLGVGLETILLFESHIKWIASF